MQLTDKTKLSDIPDSLLQKIRAQFETDRQVLILRIQQRDLMMRGRLTEARMIDQKLDAIYAKVVAEYLEEADRNIETFNIGSLPIPDADKERILSLGVVMFMACDIIESSIVDVDSAIHKYDKTLSFEMFNDIKELSERVKEKLHYFRENGGYMKDLRGGERCDDMYEMMQSKARSLMRKKNQDPNWGKNAERLV